MPSDGLIAACVDDPGAKRLLEQVAGARGYGYGLSAEAALRAVDVEARGRGSRFMLVEHGAPQGEVVLGVPGVHNVRNALGAIAAARHLGADLASIRRALAEFHGVGRRFEALGEAGGVLFVDDYAHHHGDQATLAAARARTRQRLVAVFSLYSRTRDFAAEFGRALAGADAVWVADVYPAREAPIPG